MSYNPYPYLEFDDSPASLQRFRDQFDSSFDAVTLADLTTAGIGVLTQRKGFVPRVNLRYRLFEDGWMLNNTKRGLWIPVDAVGSGGAFARLTRDIVRIDEKIDGIHAVGTEVEATQVDNMVPPGHAQAAGLIHLDVLDSQLGNVPRIANYDVQFNELETIYMDGYQGPADPFYPFLMQNAAAYVGYNPATIKPLPEGAQRDYLKANAHRLRKGRRLAVTRRHNQTPHGGDYVPDDATDDLRRPFHRVAVLRTGMGVPLKRVFA